jgi:release factor glutamine methyltransferase
VTRASAETVERAQAVADPARSSRGDGRTLADLVRAASAVLAPRHGADATAEARELAAAAYDMPRSWPVLNGAITVEAPMWARVMNAAEQRRDGAPLAYAVGRASFRHLTLEVNEHVLIPRPETEQLVELVLGAELRAGGLAVDVGTGSGAIALALATEGRFEQVIATDISLGALEVARRNAAALLTPTAARVTFAHGALLAPVGDVRARVIVSNPPYIAWAEAAALPRAVRDWEPAVALFSGDDGLATTARLVREAAALLESDGLLALEVDERRAARVAALVAQDARYRNVSVRLDAFGRERFVIGRREAR